VQAGVCEVWWAAPDLTRPAHLDLLDPAERGRREALRRDADRDRFTVGAAVLRLVAGEYLGVPAAEVVVDRACGTCGRPHGRPRIAGSDLHASVSHSGAWVAVAFSRAGPLGVDVEEIAEVDLAGLMPTVLAEDEIATVTGTADFFTYWTRKEAVVKATGDGLAASLRRVRVTAPDAPPGLRSYPGREVVAELVDLAPGTGYAAALAVLTDEPVEVREQSAAELLAR
jgi:4'-phosphopantetheinyl transferase